MREDTAMVKAVGPLKQIGAPSCWLTGSRWGREREGWVCAGLSSCQMLLFETLVDLTLAC